MKWHTLCFLSCREIIYFLKCELKRGKAGATIDKLLHEIK